MTIELVLETKPNQDQYYWVKKDGINLSDHCVYAGNQDLNTPEQTELYLAKAIKMYDLVIDGNSVRQLLIRSTIIENKSTEI